MKNIALLITGLLFSLFLPAQNTLKVMSYNILTFPEAGGIDRVDTLQKILDYYQPDLFLIQELKSEQGLIDIVNSMNVDLGNFASGDYVEQIANPSNDWRLQQNLIFNQDLFELVEQQTIVTDYRDINYFKLTLLDPKFATSNDPFLHVYVSHLKSSQGSTNENLRLGMAEFWHDHIRDLPFNSRVIIGGDFNVYSGGEPAYQKLLSPNGTNTLHDPIDMPNWASNGFNNFEIYTQSTRSNSPGNGAGGGMDDRFDFVLLSDQLMSQESDLSYVDDTYKALGNNGSCYNQDLLDCGTNNEVPFEIIKTLRFMSDHLPVVFSLEINETTSTQNQNSADHFLQIAPNPSNEFTQITWQGQLPAQLHIFDINGKKVSAQNLLHTTTKIKTNILPSGIYAIQVIDVNGQVSAIQTLVKK